jgi:hypothetical protein
MVTERIVARQLDKPLLQFWRFVWTRFWLKQAACKTRAACTLRFYAQ